MKLKRFLLAFGVLAALGCTAQHEVKVQPVEVKPIKMTIDVNIKVDRQLDEFFDFEEVGEDAEREDTETEEAEAKKHEGGTR